MWRLWSHAISYPVDTKMSASTKMSRDDMIAVSYEGDQSPKQR